MASPNRSMSATTWAFLIFLFIGPMLVLLVHVDSAGGQSSYAIPLSVTAGDQFQVRYGSDEGDIVLEASYPGARMTWLFDPDDEEEAGIIFELMAPYAGSNLSVRFSQWRELNESNVLEPLTPWIEVEVTGWIDGDGDGISDIYEMVYQLDTDDPNEDEDEDGIILLEEMYHLTDPRKTDSDGDSLEDSWEIQNGTIPFKDDTNDDPDRDSWSNIKEKVEGTDPRDGRYHPEEPPATSWVWIVIIFGVLFLILGYFVRQMFTKRKLEDDLDDFDRNASRRGPMKR